ncbi:MAG: cytochrome c3 family protein [Rhizobiaceae bacterium]
MCTRFQWLIPVFFAMLIAASGASGQTLLDIHKKAGVPCTACHSEEPPAVAAPNEICVACHGTKLEDSDAESASRPDPHLSLQLEPGEIPPCTTCHAVHGSGD